MSTDPISEARRAYDDAHLRAALGGIFDERLAPEAEAAWNNFRAAIRAQVDEDVGRLVEALRRYMIYNETFGEERLREELGPPAHEGSSWAAEEWMERVLREPARAALEPFGKED